MARRSKRNNPEQLRKKLITLLQEFELKLLEDDLREQVTGLVPANHILRDLGSSLINDDDANSARDRILAYLRKHPERIILGDELMVVAGISEYARRIRELRVQLGWPLLSGKMLTDIADDESDSSGLHSMFKKVPPDSYYLVKDTQDRDAAFRWNAANSIRKSDASVKHKILEYLRSNIGKPVTGEELKYLAKDRSEWARRVRELRTEDGWPVATKTSGRPELPIGIYILEEDRQAPEHDRKIPDPIRVSALERDSHNCKHCNWSHDIKNPSDPRSFLELHHIKHHADGGENTLSNLVTLCNVCHDDVHRGNITPEALLSLIA